MTLPAPRDLPLAGLVLAAGASQRFGKENKLLMPWGRGAAERPVICHVIDSLLRSGVADVVVVTGYDAEGVASAVSHLPVRVVHYADWASGMGGSIAAGIATTAPEARGVFVVPGDMPGLTADVIKRIAAAFLETGGDQVIVPVTETGEQRNPVLWPRHLMGALAALSGDRGAKALLTSGEVSRVDVMISDASVFADIDREEDYLALREALTS